MPDKQKGCTSLPKVVSFCLAAILILFLPTSQAGCVREKRRKSNVERPPELQVITDRFGDLKTKFSTTKKRFERGTTIPLELVIINTGKKETVLAFSSAKTHDFFIENDKGALVWQWSDGRAFVQSFMSKQLKSGQELTLTSSWNQKNNQGIPAPVGKYTVKAELNAIGRFLSLGPLHIELVD